jgi:formylglycine-generating enzyme required for sulfatase activity
MFKKGLVMVAALLLLCGLTACGKNEVLEEDAMYYDEPEIIPGTMVFIPAGEFIMGRNDKDSIAFPERKVTLPAYWIDKFEVTNKEFLDFSVKHNYTGEGAKEGRDWRLFFTAEKGMHPVVYISWNDAKAYCEVHGKRLPTEEEWEKAARGPNGNRYPWGNEWEDSRSNTYESGPAEPVAIASYDDVSYYGVYDMLGNVQEWTDTWYDTYKGNPQRDPQGGRNLKVVRGLSSRYRGRLGSLWERSAQPPGSLFDFGIRCARDATPEEIEQFQQADNAQ